MILATNTISFDLGTSLNCSTLARSRVYDWRRSHSHSRERVWGVQQHAKYNSTSVTADTGDGAFWMCSSLQEFLSRACSSHRKLCIPEVQQPTKYHSTLQDSLDTTYASASLATCLSSAQTVWGYLIFVSLLDWLGSGLSSAQTVWDYLVFVSLPDWLGIMPAGTDCWRIYAPPIPYGF